MTKKIESISLKSFKGATCPVSVDFDTKKSVVMIFGENGTGKSTLIDALDFVCNESCGSIEDRSVSTKKSDFLVSLGANLKSLEVSLKYDGQTWMGRIGPGGRLVSSGPEGRPAARILRRSQILQVVNGQPKVRYEALKSFINVPNCTKSEQSLRDAVKSIKSDFDNAARSTQQAHEALEKFWELEGKPGKTHLEWANNKITESETTLDSDLNGVKDCLAKISTCISEETALNLAEVAYETAQSELQVASTSLVDKQSEMLKNVNLLIDVLQGAQLFFESNSSVEICPVCEQTIKPSDIQGRINERLNDMKEQISLKKDIESKEVQLKGKAFTIKTKQEDYTHKVNELAAFIKDNQFIEITSLGIDWSNFSGVLHMIDVPMDILVKQSKLFLSIIKQCQDLLTVKQDNLQKTYNQITAIKADIDTINEKTKSAEQLEIKLTRLSKMLEIAQKERKDYVEDVLASISTTVENIYIKVHPKEDIGKVRWYLKPNTIGSLEFSGQFQNASDIPPQAYYSESHLDTLGICVFLALAKYYKDDNTIIVLDDVITSVDQVHMERFIKVIHDEADNFNQLIITTHYRPWRDRYKYGIGPAGNVQLIELLHWSLPRGVCHTKTKLNVDELREFLIPEKFDRQVVASKSGILLECLADYVALRYRCRLPRQTEPNYTLGDLLDSLSKKLKSELKIVKALKDSSMQEILLGPLVNQILEMTFIRNQVGCHFNDSVMVSDSEILKMGELTVEFAQSLVCNGCGEIPYHNKTGTHWECRCGMTKMYPFANPN